MLISFIQYTQRTFAPVLQLSDQFAQIQTALAAGDRIANMLDIQPTITEPDKPILLPEFAGNVTFDHVNFSYEPETPVLRDVTIQLPAGQPVAIVGATGAATPSL